MAKRVGMEVALAVAEVVGQCNIDMAAVYPITPQSHIGEHLSDLVADGKIDAEFITVEVRAFGNQRCYRRFRNRRSRLYCNKFTRADADA